MQSQYDRICEKNQGNINEYNGIGIIPRDRFDENIERQKKII